MSDVITSEGRLTGTGGLTLFRRSWRPAGAVRAAVAIVPGFNSHSGYYDWAARALCGQGFAVHAIDLRGRGQSDGERFYVQDMADYVADAGALVAHARAADPALPLFVLGHSAGGVVACTYVLDHPEGLAGFICMSFAYKVPAPDFAIAALKGLSHLFPHAHVLKLKNADFSRDPAAVAAMDADPLIEGETQPTQTIAVLARADERLKTSFGQITLPVLIMHGTADKATRPAGSQEFFDMVGSGDKVLKLYEGHAHDMLNDIGKEQVLGDIAAWISAHVPARKPMPAE